MQSREMLGPAQRRFPKAEDSPVKGLAHTGVSRRDVAAMYPRVLLPHAFAEVLARVRAGHVQQQQPVLLLALWIHSLVDQDGRVYEGVLRAPM